MPYSLLEIARKRDGSSHQRALMNKTHPVLPFCRNCFPSILSRVLCHKASVTVTNKQKSNQIKKQCWKNFVLTVILKYPSHLHHQVVLGRPSKERKKQTSSIFYSMGQVSLWGFIYFFFLFRTPQNVTAKSTQSTEGKARAKTELTTEHHLWYSRAPRPGLFQQEAERVSERSLTTTAYRQLQLKYLKN